MKVFISYAHKDQRYLDQCRRALAPLLEDGRVELFTDEALQAGQEWQAAIEKHINTADVAILLVSPAYLDSAFIIENELPALLSWLRDRQRLIPVLIEATELVPIQYRDANNQSHKIDLDEIGCVRGRRGSESSSELRFAREELEKLSRELRMTLDDSRRRLAQVVGTRREVLRENRE